MLINTNANNDSYKEISDKEIQEIKNNYEEINKLKILIHQHKQLIANKKFEEEAAKKLKFLNKNLDEICNTQSIDQERINNIAKRINQIVDLK